VKHIKEAAHKSHAAKVKALGGAVKPRHPDVAEDKALIHKMIKPSALKATGGPVIGAVKHPRAGKKKGSGKTNVNILVAPHQGGAEPGTGPGLPPAPVPAPAPPMRTPPMPMGQAGGLPNLGAGPVPPGMPPRKRGGRVHKP